MKKFCGECGKEIGENEAFCTECGTAVEKDTSEATKINDLKTFSDTPSMSSVQPVPQPVAQGDIIQPVKNENVKVISTGAYFGLMFLFALPVIGLIACIILTITAKNKNLKNFSKACLIWSIIALVISILITIIVVFIGNTVINYINTQLNTETGNQLQGFGDLFSEFREYNEVMDQFQNGTMTMPSEY